jgi:uncharacterized protein (TIRG00374 family)
MNRKTVITLIQVVVFIGLAVFLIVWQIRKMTPLQRNDMVHSMLSADLRYLVPVIFVGFFSHFFRALRWKLLLETLSIRPSTANTFFAVMIGYLVNTLLPRFGEVAKCTVLAKYEKVPADKMVGTIVAERAWDVVCLIIIMVLSLALQANVIGSYAADLFNQLRNDNGHKLLYAVIGLVLLAVILAFVYRYLKKTKVGEAIKGVLTGVRSILKLKKRRAFVGYTFGIWGCYLLMIMLGLWGLPPTHEMGWLVGLTILSFGSVSIIVTPGGLGSYPLVTQLIMPLYGVSEAGGYAFGWVAWSVQTAVVILLGIISLTLLPILNRPSRHAKIAMDPAKNL